VAGGDVGSHGGTLAYAVRPTASHIRWLFFSCTAFYSAHIALSDKLNASVVATSCDECTNPSSKDETPPAAPPRPNIPWHQAPPFIVAHDIPRGIMQLIVASINFLFMLTIM